MSAAPLLDVASRINRPTIFRSHFAEPEEFATPDEARERILQLAGGRPVTWRIGRAAYPGFKTFLVLGAHAAGETAAIAYLADRWFDERDAEAARKILEAGR